MSIKTKIDSIIPYHNKYISSKILQTVHIEVMINCSDVVMPVNDVIKHKLNKT